MKIYCNRVNDSLRQFQKLAGKDIWVKGKIGIWEYYFNVLRIEGDLVYFQWLETDWVDNLDSQYARKQLEKLVTGLENNAPFIDNYFTDSVDYHDIELTSSDVFTLDEIKEELRKYENLR